ncbi:hypothetical protein AB3X93_44855, partial [Paraburkholderia sp. BR14262]
MDGDEGGQSGGQSNGQGAGDERGAIASGDTPASSAPSPSPSPAAAREPLPRQASTLSRQALALYTALIVYGSWYPFTGWRSLGLSPFAYLGDPWPRYWTVFDIVTNVLGYMPFGALVVLAAWPRWRGWLAVLLAAIAGTLLSGVM